MDYTEAQSRLLPALNHYNIEVLNTSENCVQVSGGYTIEVEGPSLFKLLPDGAVVGPFDEIDELCQFINADQQQHG